MQRNEAVAYLKDILNSDTVAYHASINLENPTEGSGYKVRIKCVANVTEIKEIAKKHNLSIREEKDEVVVYREH